MSKRPISKASTRTSTSSQSRNLAIFGIVILAVVALGLVLFLNLRAPGEIEGLVRTPGLSRDHDNSVTYEGLDKPPPGGVHHDRWQNCGIYAEPIGTGNAIHSLEHGAVWITYRPDLPADQITRLQNQVSRQSFLLLSPFPGQSSPVVMTAWGLQLEVDSAGDSRIDDFIQQYRLGPQTPELGAACTGGVGQPIG